MGTFSARARPVAEEAAVVFPGDAPWDVLHPQAVPVARPRLVPIEAALPYLRRIDEARTYSNFGPLNALLEERLANRFGVPAGSVVTCSNATTGLALSLMALGKPGQLCIAPAWTFAATAHAILAAGMTPYLADVDPESGALTPELAAAACRGAPSAVAAVVVVAPFGAPAGGEVWAQFRSSTGLPVLLDAAAGFDALQPSDIPAVVSLHATKVLGVGEGGFVICRDQAAIADIRRRSNFGFAGSREASATGLNGKMSEYAAAVGLGALDLWPLLRVEYANVLAYYRAALAGAPGLKIAAGLGESWVTSSFCIEAPEPAVLEIERRLADAGVATRRWWGGGLHGHAAFAGFPATPLPVTDRLAARTLGLPCWPGMGTSTLDHIAGVVRSALGKA
jgi:dTDP-4-amino-4,6-dideoxygalactose transaminase